MADNKDENEKKGGIVKIAIFAAAGLLLLGIGLGIGALIFGGGSEPDPSAEVSEILDGNKPPIENKKDEEVSSYEFEPDEDEILDDLLPKNISTQIFKAFLENSASEQGSRMTAMDNATRNAGDLVDKLTINYNRSRQAAITKELIEIISGAESL